MTATYQLNPWELTEGFLQSLKNTFPNKVIRIKIEDTGDTYNADGELVREGVVVPKGEEDDPFYCAENLRWLKRGIKQAEKGKFVKKFTGEEWEAFVKEQEA
jgi:hypothetical protein